MKEKCDSLSQVNMQVLRPMSVKRKEKKKKTTLSMWSVTTDKV